MRAPANGVEIEYDVTGDGPEPVALIAGLGSQMITWHTDFCERLAARGFRVIRFDNRDVGLSTKIEDGSAYTLADMADDLAGLLDHLAIESAHLVGVSMGGMIAQRFAIDHTARTRSLTSIMSTTGAPGVGGATPEAAARLVTQPATTREERIASSMEGNRVVWGDSPEMPFDEEYSRWRAEATIDRSFYPAGTPRQLKAIRADGDRTEALRALRIPAVVIHGSNDPLIRATGGEACHAALDGSRHIVIEGMGHVVDRRAWDRIIDAIDEVAHRR
jgi:pimeloyl-ACP methyl ester carboxylesterase